MQLAEAAELARRLMDHHSLTGWTVVFDQAKTRAGVCRWGLRQIGLSAPLTQFHTDTEVYDTILHEIAHALVGPHHGHGPVWKAKAEALGCSARRSAASSRGALPGDWQGTCPAGHRVTRFRRPERVQSCARCSPRFDPEALIEWTFRGTPVRLPASYSAELAAIRALRADADTSAADAAALASAAAAARPHLPVGTHVLIFAGGRRGVLVGQVIKRGRTCYHVRTAQGQLAVPAPLVQPL